MDNGEVIPGLDESWTMAGAKLAEWMAGFIMLILAQELFFKQYGSRAMPFLLLIWIGTTLGLAATRRMFPDEERGIANKLAPMFGFTPPGLPTPSSLQPHWSGCPIRELPEEKEFQSLKLTQLFPSLEDDFFKDED